MSAMCFACGCNLAHNVHNYTEDSLIEHMITCGNDIYILRLPYMIRCKQSDHYICGKCYANKCKVTDFLTGRSIWQDYDLCVLCRESSLDIECVKIETSPRDDVPASVFPKKQPTIPACNTTAIPKRKKFVPTFTTMDTISEEPEYVI